MTRSMVWIDRRSRFVLALVSLFAAAAAPSPAVAMQGWSAPLALDVQGIPTYHDAADLNHDEKPDLVVPTRNSSTLHVFLNTGNRTFAPDSPVASISDVIAVAITDINRDGHRDLLAVGYAGSAIRVHWGAGNGTFTDGPDYPLGALGHGIVAEDLNGDGWIDAAVTCLGPDHAQVFWNDGTGVLTVGPVLATESTPYYVIAGNVNADAFLDLVVTNYGSNTIAVHLSDGSGGYSSLPPVPTGGINPGRVALVDLDGNGAKDIAVPHRWSDSVSWFLGDGVGGFVATGSIAVATPTDFAGFWAEAGDLDLDGLVDLTLGSGMSGGINVCRLNAPAQFGPSQEYPAGTNQNCVRLADFDGNGSLDISTAALDSGAAIVLFNDAADCNGNQLADTSDIAAGSSADCDNNAIPDEFQIAQDPSVDLNVNGILDGCECSVASYCVAAPNSAGPGALMSHAGTVSIGLNNLTLLCTGCPPNTTGLFFYGPQQTQVPFGNGYRCVAGPITRTGITVASSSGVAARSLDYSTLPPSGAITAGSTWNFQFWYRNPAAGGAGFNLSDGLSVQFCP